MNTLDRAESGFGTVTFDAVSWTLLGERLPSGLLPGIFQSGWAQTPAGKRSSAAKAATSALRETGMLDSTDQVEHGLKDVLVRFGLPLLRVGVRGWSADRTALSEIAVGPGYGISLTRLLRIGQGPEDRRVFHEAGVGVELALFPPQDLLSRVWRVVPAAIRGAEPAPELPVEDVVMKWPEGLGLVESLARAHRRTAVPEPGVSRPRGHRRRGPGAAPPAPVIGDRTGWEDIPPTLVDVGEGMRAVFQVTLTVHATRFRAGGVSSVPAEQRRRIRVPRGTWHGTWMTAGSRLVALRAQSGPVPSDRNVNIFFPSANDLLPGRERGPGRRGRGKGRRSEARTVPEDRRIRFLNTDGSQLYTDLALGVSGALGRQQLLWAEPDEVPSPRPAGGKTDPEPGRSQDGGPTDVR